MASVLLVDIRGWQGQVCKGDPCLNVGIAYLASSLKASGHKVVVADMNNVPLKYNDILKLISEQHADLIGLSVKTSTMGAARQLGQFIKQNASLPIILGGPHATIHAEDLIKEPWVDYVFVGEAENTLPLFCENPVQWQRTRLPGLMTPKGPPVLPNLVKELDQLPYPDYGVFTCLANAPAFNYPLITSRGCVFNCTYCSVPQISGKRFRKRKPEEIIRELQTAMEQFGIDEFSIVDDSFNLDISRAKDFCSLLLESDMKLRWSCPNGIRADRIDQELARLMKESGCHSVMIGIESAMPEILVSVNKGESLEDIECGISNLKNAGLSVGGYFIIGLPGDSFSAEEHSVAFALRHGIEAHFNMLVPYPGTDLHNWVTEHGSFLRSIEDGIHFSDCVAAVNPVFETPDFTAQERIRTYEMVHTRLSRFEFLIPKNAGKIKHYREAIRLLLKYDRRQLFKRILHRLLGF